MDYEDSEILIGASIILFVVVTVILIGIDETWCLIWFSAGLLFFGGWLLRDWLNDRRPRRPR